MEAIGTLAGEIRKIRPGSVKASMKGILNLMELMLF